MKAMILAAGRGERMRPLTDTIPKPLLPIANKPLIVHQLIQLKKMGISEVVINIAYLAEKIRQALGEGEKFGMKIIYSYEPTVLETGGGILQALKFLGEQAFILMSADVLTDYPLEKFLSLKLNTLAHLILVDKPDFAAQGDYFLKDGIVHLEGEPKLTYASFGILHPALFKNVQPGVFPLIDVLNPAITAGKVSGEYFAGNWHNVGTIAQWEKLNSELSFSSEGAMFFPLVAGRECI